MLNFSMRRKSKAQLFLGLILACISMVLYLGGKRLSSTPQQKYSSHRLNLKKNKSFDLSERRRKYYRRISNINSPNFKLQPALHKPKFYQPTGLGEFGERSFLQFLSEKDREEIEDRIAMYGINQYLSERISLHRTLKDPRPPACVFDGPFDYTSLPSTSVVIIFFNEGMSTLLRTIFSILHNTDNRLLLEIILVDDFSNLDHLKKPLEEKIKDLPKVRLYRNKKREGIMRSRLVGVSHSSGEVLVFLDAHCECTVGWLEPLLVLIQKDNSTLAVPITDDIDAITFEYHYGAYRFPNVGGFRWDLDFHWRQMSSTQLEKRNSFAEPIRTPTMSGGLFAINKKYFLKIGGYDSGMDTWGGENVELSFRTWMCGGKILMYPCSHIGHVSGLYFMYSRQSFWKNVRRAAAVWLYGHYKRVFLLYVDLKGFITEPGDVTERRKLVESLECHDFDWFLTNVYPEKYVPELRNGTFGVLKSSFADLCIRNYFERIGVSECYKRSSTDYMLKQFFEINSLGQLRNNDLCLWVDNNSAVRLSDCPDMGRSIPIRMKWKFTEDGQLISRLSKLCIEVDTSEVLKVLVTKPCNKEKTQQKWTFIDLGPMP